MQKNTDTKIKNQPPKERPSGWLKTKQAADYLGTSKPTLYRWVKDKRISPKRTPSGEFRFRVQDLDGLLDD